MVFVKKNEIFSNFVKVQMSKEITHQMDSTTCT